MRLQQFFQISKFLLLATCCLGGVGIQAQSEAQSASEISFQIAPKHELSSHQGQSNAARMHGSRNVFVESVPIGSALSDIAPTIARNNPQSPLQSAKDPEAPLLIGFGLLLLLPSLLVMTLCFFLITAPVLLPFLLAIYIIFVLIALLGLGLLIAGIVVKVKGPKEDGAEKIKGEVIE